MIAACREMLADRIFFPFVVLFVFCAGFIVGLQVGQHDAQARQARDCIALAESRRLAASFTASGACVMGGVVVLEVEP